MKVLVDEIQQAVAENEQLRDALAIKESERFSLKSKICHLRNGYVHLEDEACLLAEENERLRQVCAEAARKISEDVRDDGPCGREALTDVYIMLNEAANGGKE
jgi:predicted  nucleic acid-binding Zn-ribbon protein